MVLDIAVFRFAGRIGEKLDENPMLVIEKVFESFVGVIAPIPR